MTVVASSTFPASSDAWVAVGLAGNVVFGSRFVVQWIESERAGRSVVPPSFWWLSLFGSALLLGYSLALAGSVGWKVALPAILGVAPNAIPYARNLMLVRRERIRAAAAVGLVEAPPPAAPAPAVVAAPPDLPPARVSIVIPTFEERDNVVPLDDEIHAAMARAGIAEYEVIHVDDGSMDGTADAVRASIARDRRVRLVRLARNSGQSAAVEAGVRRARGEAVVTLDGDGQNDPADIPALLEGLRDHDCVCGWRVERRRGDGLGRVLSSRIANAVRNALSGDALPVHDSGCGLRAMRRACLERVKLFRGMHRFLPTLLRFEGFRVAEVPVRHRPRRAGRSKYGIANRLFAASRDLLAVRWMASRVVRWRIAEEA